MSGADAAEPEPGSRRGRTRAALVGAAQELIAAGRTSATSQEITERAGLGFGSFYNHFATKDELFAAAVADALHQFGAVRDDAVAGMTDPAEVFSTSFRVVGRLERAHPQIVRVLLRTGTSILTTDQGLMPRVRRDVQAGMDTGRFLVPDAEAAAMLVGGTLLGLLEHLDARPTVDDAEAADNAAEQVLRMLGVPADEARFLAHRPIAATPRA